MANTLDNKARPFADEARTRLNTIAIEIRRMWVAAGGYTNEGIARSVRADMEALAINLGGHLDSDTAARLIDFVRTGA